MVNELEFTKKKLDLNRLIEQGFELGQAKAILELGLNQRASFEKEICPRINSEIALRTKSDGTIVGIACEYYRVRYGNCVKSSSAGCIYHSMVGK